MNTTDESSSNSSHVGRALDVALRLAFVGLIVLWCGRIITPFFIPVLWGLIIATALHPLFLRLRKALGGRDKAAGIVFIVVSLALVLAPAAWLTDSVIGGAVGIGKGLENGTLAVPAPSASVSQWPVVGGRLQATWAEAAANLETWVAEHREQLRTLGSALVGKAASLGGAVVQTVLALVIAGVFMINAVSGRRLAYAFATRMGGASGRELVDMSIVTVRSVVKGVLLVALIQGLLAAVGLVFAGVPAPGFWAFLVLVVAIVQLPPILILGPIAAYVFSANGSNVVAIIFLVWSLVVSGSDGFLKPVFLGRGVAVPMLVILIGAIGGMFAAGVIGLFVGAVTLAIGFKLVEAWLGDAAKAEDPASAPE